MAFIILSMVDKINSTSLREETQMTKLQQVTLKLTQELQMIEEHQSVKQLAQLLPTLEVGRDSIDEIIRKIESSEEINKLVKDMAHDAISIDDDIKKCGTIILNYNVNSNIVGGKETIIEDLESYLNVLERYKDVLSVLEKCSALKSLSSKLKDIRTIEAYLTCESNDESDSEFSLDYVNSYIVPIHGILTKIENTSIKTIKCDPRHVNILAISKVLDSLNERFGEDKYL